MGLNMHFVDVGFSNFVEAEKILSVNRPDSSPVKRVIAQAKESGMYLDLTQGKKTRSIITQATPNGIVVTASAVQTSTIIERIRKARGTSAIKEVVTDDVIQVSVAAEQATS